MNSRVILGDCIEEARKLPARSVDLILTDPPFSSGTRKEGAKGVRKSMNRGVEDGEWFASDALTTNGFVHLMRTLALEWRRLLKPGGHALVFIDWRMMPALAAAVESADLRHAGCLVWDKTHFGMGTHFRNQHEFILHFTNGMGNPALRRDVGNVLRCKPVRNGVHPTEKPVDLLKQLIDVTCPVGGLVFDSFVGSGAAGVAAVEMGREFLGTELDPHYCTVASSRIQQAGAYLMAPPPVLAEVSA